MLKATDIKR